MDTLNLRQRILLNQPHIESVSGDIANFITDMKAPLKECKVYFEPVQEGSGDPSPDNVRLISGWEGIEIQHTKKNLLPLNIWSGITYNAPEGRVFVPVMTDNSWTQESDRISYTTTSTYTTLSLMSPLLPKGTYRLSVHKFSSGPLRYTRYALDKNYTVMMSVYSANVTNNSAMVTLDEDGYIAVRLDNGSTASQTVEATIQLEIGDTETDYKSYTGQSIPISWQSEVDTVYGGYIDLVTGELVGTYTYQTFDGDEPWSAYGSDVYRFALQPSNGFPRKKNGQNNVICDSYSAHGYNSNYYVALSGTQALYPTAQDLKDALSQNPIHACYELLEPIHYQLTPQQLLTLKGENNIWSNTNGQTEVRFWTH